MLMSTLGVSKQDLSRRRNPDNNYEKRRHIVEMWIQNKVRQATLKALFDVIETCGYLGSVSEQVEQAIRRNEERKKIFWFHNCFAFG
eukprot:m.205068 g.205068  ORF g.205068 m.205068 type:complete len:87 (+) comp39656_c0_seq2:1530-1790(+)